MRTDVAFEKLVQITPIISELRPKLKEDEKLKEFLLAYKQKGEDSSDNIDFVLAISPFLFGTYKDYVLDILAIIGDKTVDEIAAQPFGETIKQIKEILSDGDLVDFFS